MLPPSRILIVEDEEILADNLRSFLGRRTPDVRVAFDAGSALEILQSFSPDLVVLDYALPGIDGLRTYREIVRVSPRTPGCVMISAYWTALMIESARRQGICQVLCKPFSFTELQHAVDSTIEQSIDAGRVGDHRDEERRSQAIRLSLAEQPQQQRDPVPPVSF